MIIKRTSHSLFFSLTILLFILLLVPSHTYAQAAPVQVVLFYSPYCGHCQQVISEELPPIVQIYNSSYVWSYYGDPPDEETGQLPPVVAFEGDVLQILYVDTTTEIGHELYMANVETFQIPPDDQVVPIMVVGDQLLIGGIEIPAELPGLVDSWLAQGGLAWPAIPGLEDIVDEFVPFPDQGETAATPEDDSPQEEPRRDEEVSASSEPGPSFHTDVSSLSVLERIQLDPVGNTLSIIVLIGMLFALAATGFRWRMGIRGGTAQPPSFATLVLILIGAGVAGYLSFVATSGTEAVCGPVGDCQAVQDSEYAYVFGRIPNAILGLLSYIIMAIAWIVAHRSPRFADLATLGLFGLALVGTLFSAYLTFLEPFVIGATCMWCVSSAVILTVILLLNVDRARLAYQSLRS